MIKGQSIIKRNKGKKVKGKAKKRRNKKAERKIKPENEGKKGKS